MTSPTIRSPTPPSSARSALDWQFSGVGNFSGVPGETDLLLRNSKTGGLEVYDIDNNQLTGAAFHRHGRVWIGNSRASPRFTAAGASDLVLRNVNTGAFEVYDIAGNQPCRSRQPWVRSAWIGSSAASPPILRAARRVARIVNRSTRASDGGF